MLNVCVAYTGLAVAPCSVSIPSKYQTVVIDNSDNKGFLSKAKRFNYDLSAVCRSSLLQLTQMKVANPSQFLLISTYL